MSALTPICVPCRLEMRCVKNNRVVRDPEAGGFPSTYWLGDEYECPDCGARIVTGFGAAMSLVVDAERASALEFEYERKRKCCPYVGGQTTPSTENGPAETFVWCEVCPGDGEAVFAECQETYCTANWGSCVFAQAARELRRRGVEVRPGKESTP